MARLGPPPVVAPFPTSETKTTTEYTGKVGLVFHDPDNPRNKYMLVDCQESFIVGEVVVIDQDGNASQITSTSRGVVGVIVATVSASDTVAYAQIAGEASNALVTSGVTTAAMLMAPATTDGGYLDILTSTAANAVFGAVAVTAASTATSPAAGGALADLHLADGGAFVHGVAIDLGLST